MFFRKRRKATNVLIDNLRQFRRHDYVTRAIDTVCHHLLMLRGLARARRAIKRQMLGKWRRQFCRMDTFRLMRVRMEFGNLMTVSMRADKTQDEERRRRDALKSLLNRGAKTGDDNGLSPMKLSRMDQQGCLVRVRRRRRSRCKALCGGGRACMVIISSVCVTVRGVPA